MKYRLLAVLVLLATGHIAAQLVTIGVPEIDHFDPYFETGATRIHDFLVQEVAKQPGLTLVETGSFDQVVAEQERQKNEGFIDGVTADQGKYLGAQLLLIPEYDQDGGVLSISLRNIETGEISCVHSYPLNEFLPDYEIQESLYEALGTAIEECLAGKGKVVTAQVAEVLEEKSGKAKSLLIYTEQLNGLKKGDEVTIYRILKKKVGSKEVDYEEAVGMAKINEVENDNFFNVIVKSGGKEIVAFLAKKEMLYAKP